MGHRELVNQRWPRDSFVTNAGLLFAALGEPEHDHGGEKHPEQFPPKCRRWAGRGTPRAVSAHGEPLRLFPDSAGSSAREKIGPILDGPIPNTKICPTGLG